VRSSVSNFTGSAPVCRTSAISFASWKESSPVIRAPPPEPSRQARVGEVDLRERLDLAVEDDRKVLRLLAQASRGSTRRG
jgi:hypothetical protein